MIIDESYRVKKILTVFTVILGIFIVFSFLTFTGIIDTRLLADSYCLIEDDDLECTDLKITGNSITFGLTNLGHNEIVDFTINPDSNKCQNFEIESLASKEYRLVKIDCSVTAPIGSEYLDELGFSYLRLSSSSGRINSITKIKEIVSE